MQLTVPHISQPLGIWEKLEIIVSTDDKRGFYLARIEDFDAGGIVMTMPELIGGKHILKNNDIVTVMVTKGDAIYQFTSRFRKVVSNVKNLYLLSPPEKIKRVQRRHFVRIDHTEKIEYAFVDDITDPGDFRWHPATMINISGGGILFKTKGVLKKGDMILVKTILFSEMGIAQPLLGFCCRSVREKKENCYGVEFVRIENILSYMDERYMKLLPDSVSHFDYRMQEKMITFIFKKQVESRKKEQI